MNSIEMNIIMNWFVLLYICFISAIEHNDIEVYNIWEWTALNSVTANSRRRNTLRPKNLHSVNFQLCFMSVLYFVFTSLHRLLVFCH